MSKHYEARLERLLESVRTKSLSGVVITSPANIYYFTGLRLPGLLLISAEGSATLYTRRSYQAANNRLVQLVDMKHVRGDLVSSIFEELKDRRLAIGYDSLTADVYQRIIKSAPNILLSHFSESIWEIRQPKSSEEIDLLSKAAEITAASIETVREFISPGATAGDLKRFLAEEIFRAGADGLAFNPSVIVGGDLAYSMDSPVERDIREGDAVLLKAGALIGGYHASITRTFYLGAEPPETLEKAHRIALSLIEAFERSQVSWSPAATVYEKMIESARSLGTNGLIVEVFGHGLGLEERETPEISHSSVDILRESSVVTFGVEVLKPGEMGFQLSDMYVVEGKYPRRLSRLTSELPLG
jgi:Xaa-Pro aminopeptidase